MFNTLAEAIERRNADMKFIAETIARETHNRGWDGFMKEQIDSLNPELAHCLEFTTTMRVKVIIRVAFDFNDSTEITGVRGRSYNYEQLAEAAIEKDDWDSRAWDSLLEIQRGISSFESIEFIDLPTA